MEGGACQGSPWGNPDWDSLGNQEEKEGILGWKGEKCLRWEEDVCGGVGRGLSDDVSDLAITSGTPEECFPQAATFEHGSILPAKATSTPYSVSSVMGVFLM